MYIFGFLWFWYGLGIFCFLDKFGIQIFRGGVVEYDFGGLEMDVPVPILVMPHDQKFQCLLVQRNCLRLSFSA